MMPSNLKLHKSEKLCSSTAIDALFARKGKGALAFPVRMVVAKGERSHGAQVQFLISVPKKTAAPCRRPCDHAPSHPRVVPPEPTSAAGITRGYDGQCGFHIRGVAIGPVS